jgi:hypothetical protein
MTQYNKMTPVVAASTSPKVLPVTPSQDTCCTGKKTLSLQKEPPRILVIDARFTTSVGAFAGKQAKDLQHTCFKGAANIDEENVHADAICVNN